MEGIVLKQRIVRLEIDIGAVLVGGFLGLVILEDALLKLQCTHLALAVTLHLEVGAEGIDGLHTDAVEAYALLECLRVVFAAGVEHRYGLNELALRNAAAVVANADAQVVGDVNLEPVAGLHLKLIDRVVDDLLEQHVDAVLGQRTVAQTADIHAGTRTDVLHIAQVANVVISILCGLYFLRHYGKCLFVCLN